MNTLNVLLDRKLKKTKKLKTPNTLVILWVKRSRRQNLARVVVQISIHNTLLCMTECNSNSILLKRTMGIHTASCTGRVLSVQKTKKDSICLLMTFYNNKKSEWEPVLGSVTGKVKFEEHSFQRTTLKKKKWSKCLANSERTNSCLWIRKVCHPFQRN